MTTPKRIAPSHWEEQAEGTILSEDVPLLSGARLRSPALNTQLPSMSQTGFFSLKLFSEGVDTIETQDADLSGAETQISHMPLSDKEPDVEAHNPQASQAPILIVEDTPDIAEIIQATLEGIGLSTVYAGNGKQGLELMKHHLPQVILLDIGLPDITGWRMLDHIKEHYAEVKQDVPAVIIITAYGDPANKLIGKLQNVYSYLVKPVLPDQVERVVTMALKGDTPPNPASLL